jgi:hypothetical protein
MGLHSGTHLTNQSGYHLTIVKHECACIGYAVINRKIPNEKIPEFRFEYAV